MRKLYYICHVNHNNKLKSNNNMRKQYTNEDLKAMLKSEIEKCGQYIWSDRRKTIEEMLRMRGVSVAL